MGYATAFPYGRFTKVMPGVSIAIHIPFVAKLYEEERGLPTNSPYGRSRSGYRRRCRSCRSGALPATDSWE